MSRLEQMTRKKATQSWRIKAAGCATIVAGFCTTIGAFRMNILLDGSPFATGILPVIMLVGIGTILAGLLFTRGMSQAGAASIWLTMVLGLGGVIWNSYIFETVGVFPINIAAAMCSLVAFTIAPVAWMEIRQIRRKSYYAAL